ncbi:MAG: amidohydrolase [Thermodesulfobacteriota bacterium]
MPAHTDDSATVLKHGLILPDPETGQVFAHGATVITGDRLAEVNVQEQSAPHGARVLDCRGCLIMPGLVNAHTHAAMSLLRGIADDLPLDRWLNEYMFPAESRHANEEFVRLGTMLSAAEMALAGITTFADGYFHMEQAADAARQVGLRAVIAQGILDVPAPDAPEPGTWKRRAESFLDLCPRDSLVTPGLFCHSAYLCAPQTLKAARELASRHGLRLFCHVAETEWEVREIRIRYGCTPVELLASHGLLGPDFVAVHCVHLSEADQDVLARTGTPVVHCPESNMKLASGAAPVWNLIRRGVTVAIGTDGPASNNNLDLIEEMRTAALMAKLVTRDPEALDARTLLRMATTNGARALGMDHRIGSLEPGKLADITILDLSKPHLLPLYDPVSHLVYSARGSDVRDVFVGGRQIVQSGKLVTVDQEALAEQVGKVAAEIGRELGVRFPQRVA